MVEDVLFVFGYVVCFLIVGEVEVLVFRVGVLLKFSIDSSVFIEDIVSYLISVGVSNVGGISLDLVVEIGNIEVS